MKRREFITLLGSAAAAWPLAAHAQQPPPVIGFLRPTRAEESGHLVAAVRQGLREAEYPSVVIESRWGEGREEGLPKLAAELVALRVAAIVAGSLPSARATKAATATIPIIFVTGADPQTEGLVSSISRPGGNLTGVSFYDIPVTGKRLALLRELIPKAETIAVLQDPNSATFQSETREIEAAVRATGQKIIGVKAGSEQEINAAFSTVAKSGASALLVGGGQFFNGRRNQLVGLAALNAIPARYVLSGFVDAGGLVSYGASQTDAYRRAGVYVARILKGENPGDLPVELPTKYEMVINLKTAKAFHTDPETAKSGPFGGLIASGWHTAGLMTRLFMDHYLTKVASLGSPGDELRWVKPVRPGDTLSVRVTVLRSVPSKSKPDRGAVTSFIEVINQAGEVVMTFRVVNIIAKRWAETGK